MASKDIALVSGFSPAILNVYRYRQVSGIPEKAPLNGNLEGSKASRFHALKCIKEEQ